MAARYTPVTLTHEIPERPQPFVLWREGCTTCRVLPRSRSSKASSFTSSRNGNRTRTATTGCTAWRLAWHKGKLYASFGHNKGEENTVTEEARYRVSEDGGKTWSDVKTIDVGTEEPDLAVSSGVFCSQGDTLWAFHGAFYGKMGKIHTRAYSLDEATGEWTKHGVVVEDGFWPLNQPVKMDDGNWIMPGGSFGVYSNEPSSPRRSRSATATISRSGTSSGSSRTRRSSACGASPRSSWTARRSTTSPATAAGRGRWSRSAKTTAAPGPQPRISNLPMATSKPAAGHPQHRAALPRLHHRGGQRRQTYAADHRRVQAGRRTIRQVFVIRKSQNPGHPGESADHLGLSYPYAIEHEGKLYVGYSNNGGRRGNSTAPSWRSFPFPPWRFPNR